MGQRYLGLDGCRRGWIGAFYSKDTGFEPLRLIESLTDLKEDRKHFRRIFVDIPMGFPKGGSTGRDCDRLARVQLKARRTSVFSVPVRPALDASDYRAACAANHAAAGKKISVQTWNLFPRMLEADRLLSRYACLKKNVFESHPEICFYMLNGRHEMRSSKKAEAGRRERLKVLRAFAPEAGRVFNQGLKDFRRKDAAADDLLDAMVLALSASMRLAQFPERRVYDQKKIPMRIVFPRPIQERRIS